MPGALRVAVAASGGPDSSALLHATVRLARTAGIEVHALHVHHGLHPDADAWLRSVARQCRRWGAILHSHREPGAPQPGDSIEAWARRIRYRALAAMAHAAGCSLVLLAHHRRDQAETVLLQALRGAGPAGLAAMPRVAVRDGITWARPWLEQPIERLEAYRRWWRLGAVIDPANTDRRYARSRLRLDLWPVLQQGFADAEIALLAVARRAQEARAVLDEAARVDAAAVVRDGALQRTGWLGLSTARRANVLRHWLATLGQGAPPESLVQRLLEELPCSRAGTWPAGAGLLVLHRDQLMPLRRDAPPAAGAIALDLSRPGVHEAAPWRGVLRVADGGAGGVPAALLARAELRPRSGGERFQSHAGGVPRSLKKQFQAAGVPRWQRDAPLVYGADGHLLFVPGLGLDARACSCRGAPRLLLAWEPT